MEEIDHLVACDMEVRPGRVVLAMILDALSGRSPLFRHQDFFVDRGMELLLGENIPLARLADYALQNRLLFKPEPFRQVVSRCH